MLPWGTLIEIFHNIFPNKILTFLDNPLKPRTQQQGLLVKFDLSRRSRPSRGD